MRQLHVVALSEDGRSVLLATSKTAKTGGFSLPIDTRLAAALRGDLPRPGEQQAREVGVTPKEIQARLRAGESPEQIAASAGVPVARVERFAGPVLSERERIIDEARAGYLSRTRRGASQLPLGDAVDAALAETSGLRADSVTWTARRLDSGHWLVQVSYVARARTKTASWVYEPHTRSVTASDATSAALGHVGEETSARPAAPVHRVAAPARKAPRPAARRSTPARPKPVAKKVAATKPVAKKATAPKPAAKKVAAPKPAAKKVAATKPVAKKATAPKPVAKKVAAPKPAVKKVAAPKPVAKKVAAPKPVAKKVAAPTRVAAKAAPVATPKPDAGAPRRTASRKLRRSAAAEATAATPVVKWGPPVESHPPAGPPTLRVVPQPAPEPEPTPAPVATPPAVARPPEPSPPPAPAAPAQPVVARKRRAAGERAHVPDWADVLLGATPKRPGD